jgi:collagenase-like PrtC family protease
MTALEFSVPYNNDLQTLGSLLALNGRNGNAIREIYLGAPEEIIGSGRVGKTFSMQSFLAAAAHIHDAGVRVDVTMNSSCDGSDWYDSGKVTQQVGFIRAMHEDHGVEAVTLANPFFIEKARKACPDLEISASVLADIDCFSRAQAFASAGADVMTVDATSSCCGTSEKHWGLS